MENDRASQTASRNEESVSDLVSGAIRSDVVAWNRLVRRFGGMVRGIARGHGLNEADASDVAQTVWLRLFQHLEGVREPDRLGGWLATTARRESLRMLRRREVACAAEDGSPLDRSDDTADPEASVDKMEMDGVLVQLIETLPGHHRQLVELLVADPPLSYKEISVTLGIPVGSIGPTRQRCLAVMRRKAVSAGIGPDARRPQLTACA